MGPGFCLDRDADLRSGDIDLAVHIGSRLQALPGVQQLPLAQFGESSLQPAVNPFYAGARSKILYSMLSPYGYHNFATCAHSLIFEK